MIDHLMLELTEELINPEDAYLDDQVEKAIDAETDVLYGDDDGDDELIDFIDKGKRLTNSDPVDFTDDDVEEIIQDDMED